MKLSLLSNASHMKFSTFASSVPHLRAIWRVYQIVSYLLKEQAIPLSVEPFICLESTLSNTESHIPALS